ncbi:MAG TPA: BON domain-containing protein [Acidimicrobiia bacterium]|nr:BON domain-containing protein [Acidimicrobiia bacterium]HIL46125.1 BON domain-containing protein [Acidimicrobiia bacterium]
MNNWMRDPRQKGSQSFGPAFGGPRQPMPSRRGGFFSDLIAERRGLLVGLVVLVFFIVIAFGADGRQNPEEEQLGLAATVQGAMVQAGLPTVEVRNIDWTIVLEGRIATTELKEAATRVAQAQNGVVGVDNRLIVPEPVEIETDISQQPDLPAAMEDLLLQARLSATAAYTPIQFESGSDRLAEDSLPVLEMIATFLTSNTAVRVQIIGHTDSEGDEGENLTLSTLRAEAVRSQLIARGIDAERLLPLGMGEYDPIADNVTQVGKARNRRIEFLVLPEGNDGMPAPTTTEPSATTTLGE